MTLPANIRINTSVPFPSLVQGSGPVTVAKKSGIWTLGLSFSIIGAAIPPAANFSTDYVLVWDSLANSYIRVPLSVFASGARSQRLVTAGPVVFASTDQVVNLKLSNTFTSTLPSYLSRGGVPLTICDLSKLYGVTFFAQQFNASNGETIDGAASISITQAGQSISLMPMNDGTSAGWKVI